MTYQRPAGAYSSTSTTTNATKYQDDATAVPKRAISSSKVDGDLNYIIDALNELLATGLGGALPGQAGNNGKVITTDGSNALWSLVSAANMASNGVTAGSYTLANITVDAKGLVTAAASGTVGTAQITDGAVTSAKIALGASGDTGDFKWSVRSSLTGWLLCDGKTIGNGSSGATSRANADTSDLFTVLWNELADAQAPVSGGRGLSAAADFAANKTITLPDAKGRAFFGLDNMGGTAANRVTNANSGIAGTTKGAVGGDERLHQHSHGVTDPGHAHPVSQGGAASGTANNSVSGTTNATIAAGNANNPILSNTTGITINNFGSGSSQNMPPAMMQNCFIRL